MSDTDFNPENSLPTISIVIETFNDESGPVLDLDDSLQSLNQQNYPVELVDISVVVDLENPTLKNRLVANHPEVRVIEIENPNYYSMKILGIKQAQGDIVAVIDSDCIAVPGWLRAIVDSIANGADAIAGKTRYPEGANFAHTFNFFNFGYIQATGDGSATAFLPNNVAFRREVVQKHNFDQRFSRSGAAHLLSGRLKKMGYRVVYNPEMLAFHNCYGFREEFKMRIKAGYDFINKSRIDDDHALEETSIVKHGKVLGLVRVWLRCVIFDLRALIRNREDLAVRLFQIPYFLLVSIIFRSFEFGAALLTLIKPNYLKDKFDW